MFIYGDSSYSLISTLCCCRSLSEYNVRVCFVFLFLFFIALNLLMVIFLVVCSKDPGFIRMNVPDMRNMKDHVSSFHFLFNLLFPRLVSLFRRLSPHNFLIFILFFLSSLIRY